MSKNGHAPTLKVAREIRQQERREEKERRRGERHKAKQAVSPARVAGASIDEAARQSDRPRKPRDIGRLAWPRKE